MNIDLKTNNLYGNKTALYLGLSLAIQSLLYGGNIMIFRKFKLICFAFIMLLSVSAFGAEVKEQNTNVGIYINGGKKLDFKNVPYITNGVVYVPLREMLEKNDGVVKNEDNKITVITGTLKVTLTKNSNECEYNGTQIYLKHMLETVNGITYISIEDINTIDRNIGYHIEYEQESNGGYKVLLRRNERSDEQKKGEVKDFHFALKLLNETSKVQNMVISPKSMETVLAMVANGTEGESRNQILGALNITELNKYNEKLKNTVQEQFQSAAWSSANSIWAKSVNGKFEWNQKFLKIIKDCYKGITDSIEDENEIDKINIWIAENTNGQIKDAIKDSEFDLMLLNAAHFKGSWKVPFDKSNTKEEIFYNNDKSQSNIDFMELDTSNVRYYEEEGLSALTLDYGIMGRENTPYDMTFIMTDNELNNEMLNRIYNYQDYQEVLIKLPKFKIENEFAFIDVLKKLGIQDIFDAAKANLSPMTDEKGYFVTKVIQNATINIDEEGTEAAAVSIASAARDVMSKESVKFIANSPFYYLIRNSKTGDILFEGYFGSANN